MILMVCYLNAQHQYNISASLNAEGHTLNIQQEIQYANTSNDTLNAIYLNDWANAYSSTDSPLSLYLGEEFERALHLAKQKDKGFTKIISLTDNAFRFLDWQRPKDHPDLIRVQLKSPIFPGKTYKLQLSYTVKLPNARFTRYGVTAAEEYNLRYWYITPTVYRDGEWKSYSNKNLDDLYLLPSKYDISFTVPKQYQVITDLNVENIMEANGKNSYLLKGENRTDVQLYLNKSFAFNTYSNDTFTTVSDIKDGGVTPERKAVIVSRVSNYIEENLGAYPFKKLLVSEVDYKKNPVYGLNQLPSFISPFSDEFLYEIKILKATLGKYLENTLPVDPRKEKWVTDGLQTYLMMQYLNETYPDMKLLGNLSKIWGLRSYQLAKLNFNDAYPFLYFFMARKNLDQPLTTSKDSLVKFNYQIGNKYKAGLGLKYLDKYLENNEIPTVIKQFYKNNLLNDVTAAQFESELKTTASKNIDWYFEEYVNTRHKIDFKIKNVHKTEDSIQLTIKNKTKTNVPISLFTFKDDSIVGKYWLDNISEKARITIPRNGADKLVLNHDKAVPEFNQRDNHKSLKGFFANNRPLSFKFFKDAEDPDKKQVFFVPTVTFNVYDGISTGIRFSNRPFLRKPFTYGLSPIYSSKEKSLIGSGKLQYNYLIEKGSLYDVQYRLDGARFHYAPGLTYTSVTPSVTFAFRTEDFRDNQREFLFFRYVDITRRRDDSELAAEADPDYSIFNARYVYSNPGAINFKSWFTDLQIAPQFAKLSINGEYRKLFTNNRQLNLRFFAGKFIYNDTKGDFFSYALDRPTDYLFDYAYLGRSEDTGLVSQQLIVAEGGFKSKLDTPFANDWIVTGNASINMWRWIEAYGDIGFVKNRGLPTKFVYDSGVRLNLVPDYFELYFPLYSNNGWETSLPNYDQKIRFVFTMSPRTLLGLFTRKWF